MSDDPLWMCAADLRREVVRLRRVRDAVIAHADSPAVPHSTEWDDQLEAIYQTAKGCLCDRHPFRQKDHGGPCCGVADGRCVSCRTDPNHTAGRPSSS